MTPVLSGIISFLRAYLPPANEVCERYVLTPVCQSFCSQGGGRACVVAGGGVCVVAGGMHCCRGGVRGCGGHAWLWGGMRGCRGACVGYDEIRSMSGQHASYWNAFLFNIHP